MSRADPSAWCRFALKLAKDSKLKRTAEKIERAISMSRM